MNRSITVTRYARALVKYVAQTGHGEAVCQEADALASALRDVPGMQRMMDAGDDLVRASDKKKLLQNVLGNGLSPEMDRFLDLILRNGRSDLLQDILRDFADQYRRGTGVRKAHLVTVEAPSEDLLQRLRALVKEKTGANVMIEVEQDPALVGGFVFDIDDYILDASIKRQLDLIRDQFVERNRRIV